MIDHSGEVFGSYRLKEKRGVGGFSQVYLGENEKLSGTFAAVKILVSEDPTVIISQEDKNRFIQEAKLVYSFNHPNIIRYFGYDIRPGDNIPFLVMEYVSGGSILELHPEGMILDIGTVVNYVKQLAGALEHIHDAGIVYRDIKPANVLVRSKSEKTLLLADFGIAVPAYDSKMPPQEPLGTWPYSAPEQFLGKAERRSDIYSLAILTYELLCGERPFFVPEGSDNTGGRYFVKHSQEDPPPMNRPGVTVSSAVEQVVLKALAKDPKERFATVKDFAEQLEQAALGTQPQSHTKLPSPPDQDSSSGLIPPMEPTKPLFPSLRQGPATGPLSSRTQPILIPPPTYLYRSNATLHIFRGHKREVYSVAWSPDGKYIASGSSDRTVRIWDVAQKTQKNGKDDRCSRAVRVVTWSPDGKYIAFMSTDQAVQVKNVFTGDVLPPFKGHVTSGMGIAFALAWSPDSLYLASGGDNKKVFVWSATSRSYISIYHGHEGRISAVAWSPDGKHIASGSSDRTMQVWNALPGTHALTYEGHTGEVRSIAWSPDSKYLASAYRDQINIWDATNKDKLTTTYPHHKGVNAVAWSPDGKYIASGGDDRTVQIWDVSTKKIVFVYLEHLAPVRTVAWSPDGKYIASGDEDNLVCLWEIK